MKDLPTDDPLSVSFAQAVHPIDAMWAHFIKFHAGVFPPDQIEVVQDIFYMGCYLMYNGTVAALRAPSPQTIAQFTLGCRQDLGRYFEPYSN